MIDGTGNGGGQMGVTIGVDVGGTKIAAGVVDEHGQVLARMREKTPVSDADATLARIADVVQRLQVEVGPEVRESIGAVGLSVAGLVDKERSIVRLAPNLGWSNLPARERVSNLVDLPVTLDNDANCAAWAEYRHGAGRGYVDAVTITVGTGIGGGMVLDGVLYRGGFGAAAEVGHMVIERDGRLCPCGMRGCWEQYASGNALVRTARELAAERRDEAQVLLKLGDGSPEGIVGRHITDAARQGDPVARDAYEVVGSWLGRGMAVLVAVLDPSVFVIGGGVAESGDLLAIPTGNALHENIFGLAHRPEVAIRTSPLGNDAGLIGAADLARALL